MRKLNHIWVLLIVLLSLSSCFKIEDVQIKEIESVKLLEFTTDGLLVESSIQIENPNNYDIKIVDSEFNVNVNNRKIGQSRIGTELTIPANSSDFHTLILQSSQSDLSSSAIPSLIAITASGQDQLKFKVDGFIVGKLWFISKKFEEAHEGMVDLRLF